MNIQNYRFGAMATEALVEFLEVTHQLGWLVQCIMLVI